MNSKSWRGTILFTVILVVMGATVGLKLYGVGEQVAASPVASQTTATSSAASATPTPNAASTSAATTSGPPAAAAPASPAPATQTPATKTVTGSTIDTRYGPVQVKVTFSGSAITAIDMLQVPNGNGRDVEINDQALPILNQEAMSAQSAAIDTVSGATYTSEGYIQSLQSAIDQR